MDDQRIEQAIQGVIDVAASNFPSSTDITISSNGNNSASVKVPHYVLKGLLEAAKKGRAK